MADLVLDLEDIDPDEGDLDALLGRKSMKANKAKQLEPGAEIKSGPASTDEVEKPLQPPLAHAPFFCRDHAPRWHVFLSDETMQKIAVPPFALTTFSRPLFTETGAPTFNMQTFKMQFQAPPKADSYPFVAHVICDSYIGMDSREAVVLVVEDAAKEEVASEDEISEPDEDSLAGQMHALKSGQPLSPSTKRRSKKAREEESSDEESDTEGDDGDDTSETNTVRIQLSQAA